VPAQGACGRDSVRDGVPEIGGGRDVGDTLVLAESEIDGGAGRELELSG
jgi:hypothetical protein